MSFEIFLQSFENERKYVFPTSELLARFKGYIKEEDGDVWRLGFEEGFGLSDMYISSGETTDGFMIRKPPDSLEFWQIISGLLKDYPSVLFWPGSGAVMGSLDLLPHLPKDFVDTFGIPWVSTDPERIRRYVWDNS